ncbi:hypothetical protein Ahos_1601 [Acidianus hospitalis W1]|uniref:Uncharacterized protein n=1 Tax=Acidianus hospitalis (strain W1) TaxID=933801 RepID=F4B5Y3_ACIHW|nr:hypothetical protein Ahos_1601 [Acidianus hospitalis W1]
MAFPTRAGGALSTSLSSLSNSSLVQYGQPHRDPLQLVHDPQRETLNPHRNLYLEYLGEVLLSSSRALLSISAVSFIARPPQLPQGGAQSPRDWINISRYGLALVSFSCTDVGSIKPIL